MSENLEFNLIIEKAGGEPNVFAEAFGLDPALTQKMLKTVPLVFASKLTRAEVRALTPRLQELSKHGFEFRITHKSAKAPLVNWLARPNFAVPSNGAPGPFAFDFQNTAFICPGCGEAFAFTRVGKVPLAETPASEAAAAAASMPSSPLPKPVALTPMPAPMKVNVPKPSSAPPLEPKPELELESPNAPPLELDEPKAPSFSDTDMVEPLDIQPLDDPAAAPLESSEKQSPAPAAKAKTSTGLSEALEDSIQEQKAATAAAKPAAPGQELYNVFVPEVKDKARLDEVVKLLTEIRGVPEEEARKLTRRLMIPVAKGVTKVEAEKILMQFKKIKTTGRMTKAAPGAGE